MVRKLREWVEERFNSNFLPRTTSKAGTTSPPRILVSYPGELVEDLNRGSSATEIESVFDRVSSSMMQVNRRHRRVVMTRVAEELGKSIKELGLVLRCVSEKHLGNRNDGDHESDVVDLRFENSNRLEDEHPAISLRSTSTVNPGHHSDLDFYTLEAQTRFQKFSQTDVLVCFQGLSHATGASYYDSEIFGLQLFLLKEKATVIFPYRELSVNQRSYFHFNRETVKRAFPLAVGPSFEAAVVGRNLGLLQLDEIPVYVGGVVDSVESTEFTLTANASEHAGFLRRRMLLEEKSRRKTHRFIHPVTLAVDSDFHRATRPYDKLETQTLYYGTRFRQATAPGASQWTTMMQRFEREADTQRKMEVGINAGRKSAPKEVTVTLLDRGTALLNAVREVNSIMSIDVFKFDPAHFPFTNLSSVSREALIKGPSASEMKGKREYEISGGDVVVRSSLAYSEDGLVSEDLHLFQSKKNIGHYFCPDFGEVGLNPEADSLTFQRTLLRAEAAEHAVEQVLKSYQILKKDIERLKNLIKPNKIHSVKLNPKVQSGDLKTWVEVQTAFLKLYNDVIPFGRLISGDVLPSSARWKTSSRYLGFPDDWVSVVRRDIRSSVTRATTTTRESENLEPRLLREDLGNYCLSQLWHDNQGCISSEEGVYGRSIRAENWSPSLIMQVGI